MTLSNHFWRNQLRNESPGPVNNLEQLIKEIGISLIACKNEKNALPDQGQRTDVQNKLQSIQKLNQAKSPAKFLWRNYDFVSYKKILVLTLGKIIN